MTQDPFQDADRAELERRGIPEDEARRQLAQLASPPGYARLVRPCTVGDGIETLSARRRAELDALHGEAAAVGRCSKFVPASGAASRMFRELIWFRSGDGAGASWESIRAKAAAAPDSEAAVLVAFLDDLPRFPFAADLDWVLRSRGERAAPLLDAGRYGDVLDALLAPYGLDYARLPKGLLKFHSYADGARTAFEEHLVEAPGYVRDADGRCRLHLTVSPGHREAFRQRLAEVGDRYRDVLGARYEVDWSAQEPSSDTLALDAAGRPVRTADGGLLFRPGGHGALIRNLDALGGDVVFVKNIDNVQPDRVKPTVGEWKRALGGLLVELQRRTADTIERLRNDEGSGPLSSLISSLGPALHISLNGRPDRAAAREELIRRIDRPLRVCGVVRNTGEPGGGPFWVRGADGVESVQIVESAQVDPDDAEQQAIFRSSTHFNPVDLVCGVRGAGGKAYDLERYIDHDAVIVTTKSSAGAPIRVLERPGLWNGAMAHWNTVFVEVPLETFSPVKSVMDLLRPEHQ